MARSHRSHPTPLTRSSSNSIEEKDTADVPTLDTIHDLLVTNIEATKVQQQINRDAREVEKNKELNQSAVIAWLSDFRVYRQRKGYQKLVNLVDSAMHEVYAKRCCKLTFADFLLLEDDEFCHIWRLNLTVPMLTFTRRA